MVDGRLILDVFSGEKRLARLALLELNPGLLQLFTCLLLKKYKVVKSPNPNLLARPSPLLLFAILPK